MASTQCETTGRERRYVLFTDIDKCLWVNCGSGVQGRTAIKDQRNSESAEDDEAMNE
jgi:hypothetical protein